MTYNIRYGTAKDGPNNWENRKNILLESIRKRSPAIICLQESIDFQTDYLVTALRRYEKYGDGRDWNRQGESTSILVDTLRFKVVESITRWFCDRPDEPGCMSWGNRLPRIYTRLKIKSLNDKRRFVLYNMHLDHESSSSRIKSVNHIIEDSAFFKDVIITGDFNATPDSDEVAIFCEEFRDLMSGCTDGTFHGFTGKARLGERIDYILVRGDVLEPKRVEIVRDCDNGRYPSDHFALFAA